LVFLQYLDGNTEDTQNLIAVYKDDILTIDLEVGTYTRANHNLITNHYRERLIIAIVLK
jgi:hypothetical protein